MMWLLELVAHVLVFMSRHDIVLVPVLIFGGIILAATRTRAKPARPSKPAVIGFEPDPPPRRDSRRWMLAPLMIGTAILNLLFGAWISGIVVYALGVEGKATITGTHGTGTVYNDQRVMRHDVLIRTAGGKTVESSFDDDDFNIYPSHNTTTYPGEGDEFNVRYLRSFPTDFVILGEDDSPWAHGLHCSRLARLRSEAEAKAGFAPDVDSYRDAVAAARDDEAKAGCGQEQ